MADKKHTDAFDDLLNRRTPTEEEVSECQRLFSRALEGGNHSSGHVNLTPAVGGTGARQRAPPFDMSRRRSEEHSINHAHHNPPHRVSGTYMQQSPYLHQPPYRQHPLYQRFFPHAQQAPLPQHYAPLSTTMHPASLAPFHTAIPPSNPYMYTSIGGPPHRSAPHELFESTLPTMSPMYIQQTGDRFADRTGYSAHASPAFNVQDQRQAPSPSSMMNPYSQSFLPSAQLASQSNRSGHSQVAEQFALSNRAMRQPVSRLYTSTRPTTPDQVDTSPTTAASRGPATGQPAKERDLVVGRVAGLFEDQDSWEEVKGTAAAIAQLQQATASGLMVAEFSDTAGIEASLARQAGVTPEVFQSHYYAPRPTLSSRAGAGLPRDFLNQNLNVDQVRVCLQRISFTQPRFTAPKICQPGFLTADGTGQFFAQVMPVLPGHVTNTCWVFRELEASEGEPGYSENWFAFIPRPVPATGPPVAEVADPFAHLGNRKRDYLRSKARKEGRLPPRPKNPHRLTMDHKDVKKWKRQQIMEGELFNSEDFYGEPLIWLNEEYQIKEIHKTVTDHQRREAQQADTPAQLVSSNAIVKRHEAAIKAKAQREGRDVKEVQQEVDQARYGAGDKDSEKSKARRVFVGKRNKDAIDRKRKNVPDTAPGGPPEPTTDRTTARNFRQSTAGGDNEGIFRHTEGFEGGASLADGDHELEDGED